MTITTQKRKNGSSSPDWNGRVLDRVLEEINAYNIKEESKPNLRTIYYILVDAGDIPGTPSAYKSLSAAIVRAKKAGKFPLDCFIDTGRNTMDFLTVLDYQEPEDYIEKSIKVIKNFHDYYEVPRWHNQKHYCEVWIEKSAIAGVFKNYLSDRDVPIAPNKGNTGYQYYSDNCERLREVIDTFIREGKKKQVHVFYFGDYDPSGANMNIYLKENLKRFDLYDIVDFQRIALTLEQIVKYNILFKPQDLDTMEKLLADNNIKKFCYNLRQSKYYRKIRAKLYSLT